MGLRLFFLPNFPGARFIQGHTFIPDSRVVIDKRKNSNLKLCLIVLTECWCTSWALGHNDALMAAVGRAARAAWAAWAVWAGRLGHVYSNTFSYSTMPTFVSFFELSSFPQKTTMGLNSVSEVTFALAWHILLYFAFSIIEPKFYTTFFFRIQAFLHLRC